MSAKNSCGFNTFQSDVSTMSLCTNGKKYRFKIESSHEERDEKSIAASELTKGGFTA